MKDYNTEFMNQLSKLSPLEFCGLARLFGVPIVYKKENDEIDAREFDDVFSDIMKVFSGFNREDKRDALRFVKGSNRSKLGRAIENGSNPKNS